MDEKFVVFTPETLADAIDLMIEEGEFSTAQEVSNWIRSVGNSHVTA